MRSTDAALVSQVLDGLIVRAALALPLACGALDESAAEALREALLAAHGAVALRQSEVQTEAWQRALAQVARQQGAHELLQGLATRLLLDAGVWEAEQVATGLSLHLSRRQRAGQAPPPGWTAS